MTPDSTSVHNIRNLSSRFSFLRNMSLNENKQMHSATTIKDMKNIFSNIDDSADLLRMNYSESTNEPFAIDGAKITAMVTTAPKTRTASLRSPSSRPYLFNT